MTAHCADLDGSLLAITLVLALDASHDASAKSIFFALICVMSPIEFCKLGFKSGVIRFPAIIGQWQIKWSPGQSETTRHRV